MAAFIYGLYFPDFLHFYGRMGKIERKFMRKKLMKDFYMLPRQIRRDFVDGIINNNEMLILVWMHFYTNPVDGRCEVSYQELVTTFHNEISYQSMRKIISNLRKADKIWFDDHKGKPGKFAIYPFGIQRTDGHIQTKDDFVHHPDITDVFNDKPSHNLESENHNSDYDNVPEQ